MRREPLGWFGTMTAVLFGSLAAWAVVLMVMLVLWLGACGLALSELDSLSSTSYQ